MSTSITTAFITDYDARARDAFQREGSLLLKTVDHKQGVVGSTAVFQLIGTGVATTKARHGTVTPMNVAHTAPSATLADFYAPEYVDKLDELKTNIAEREKVARAGALALGRQVDSQITTTLDGTTQTIVTWAVTSQAAIRNSLINMSKSLFANDIPNDRENYAALTAAAWAFALTVQEFTRADWVGVPSVLTDGPPIKIFKEYVGIKWMMHTGLPGKDTATAKVFVWNKSAIGYASALHARQDAGNGPIAADISWVAERVAWLVNHMMSGGSVLIQDAGVIEGNLNDTTALPTS